ncbi:hypothetical protein M1B72_04890 [Geomonas paludis]|uniref:ATP-grasp domain-containing protein n=1 Tax=Geomonas paludis TaxID=2740185 RepID=A0A6V8MXB6_9BACT|nr:hypothetical protein [Geomonas paludis]UPU37047.1 hypothetical protein M1B72_04890 [Geomonas paludis]GFO64858.1 hypothetical protein GMPD_27770 [Geomonas paludis]
MNRLCLRALTFLKQNRMLGPLRRYIQKHLNLVELRTSNRILLVQEEECPSCDYEPAYPYTLGILKEFWHGHRHYVKACHDLRVRYQVLDITGPDWQEEMQQSGCDVYLVLPSVTFSNWKQMYDERVRVIAEDLGMPIFPSYSALWMWESKRRTFYWLKANGISHPRTWVFYDRSQALQFAARTDLPVVFKSNMGSGASGVIIFERRSQLRRHISRCFCKGYTNERRGPNDREVGSVLFQEYLPNLREWRVVRIGPSYFAFEKVRSGRFHSGSHLRTYGMPPAGLLDFARAVFDAGGFTSLSLDVFITEDGRFLVNELHTYFGILNNHEMCMVDGIAGRMLHEPPDGWRFEPGDFCGNYLYNQRVLCVLDSLQQKDRAGVL